MSNKRITDLTELTTPTTDDVFPVVDIATNTTTKVQLGNLPVPSSVTTALATKQDSLVSGTNIKTINSTSVLGSGNIAVQPTLVSGTSIKTVNSNSLLGAGDVAVQETLVSGTNIKTLNNTSLLGSGNITLTANPSGVAGAIQFSNGSAFASDAANLFWDDTNNRLGIGTNVPTSPFTLIGASQFGNAVGSGSIETFDGFYSMSFGKSTSIYNPNNNHTRIFMQSSQTFVDNTSGNFQFRSAGTTVMNLQSGNLAVGNGSDSILARTHIKGSGSTSATTSLLVQNSAGLNGFRVNDDQSVGLHSNSQVCFNSTALPNNNNGFRILTLGSGKTYLDGWSDGTSKATNYPLIIGSRVQNVSGNITGSTTTENGTPVVFGSDVYDASALVQMNSTTRGFLPPRMTTTQKNAITSPAAGLVVYDSTTNKLCCYNGSTWNDLF